LSLQETLGWLSPSPALEVLAFATWWCWSSSRSGASPPAPAPTRAGPHSSRASARCGRRSSWPWSTCCRSADRPRHAALRPRPLDRGSLPSPLSGARTSEPLAERAARTSSDEHLADLRPRIPPSTTTPPPPPEGRRRDRGGQQERFSPRSTTRLPHLAIQYVLHERHKAEQLDGWASTTSRCSKFERMLSTYVATFPARSTRSHRDAGLAPREALGALIIRKELKPTRGRSSSPSTTCRTRPRASCPRLRGGGDPPVDGVGEWATASYGSGAQRHHDVEGDPLPHSLGLSTAPSPTTSLQVNSRVQGDGPRPLREAVHFDRS